VTRSGGEAVREVLEGAFKQAQTPGLEPKTTHFTIQKPGRPFPHRHPSAAKSSFLHFLNFLIINYSVFVASKNNSKTRAF